MTVLSKVVRGSLRVTSFDVGADGKARRFDQRDDERGRAGGFISPVNNVPRSSRRARRRLCTGRHRAALRRGCGRDCHTARPLAVGGGVFRLSEIPEPADFECLRRRVSGAAAPGLSPLFFPGIYVLASPRRRVVDANS